MLNSELHILHISVMIFQSLTYFLELSKCLREFVSHLSDLHRCTNTCYYVLTLCVGQELTEQALSTGSRISGKCNTGTTVITHVTECHRLNVNSSTPGIRDIVVTTINVCTRVVPGTEYSFDSAHQLFLGIIREVYTDLSLVLSLELASQFLQIISSKLNVLLNTLLLFHCIDQLLEVLLTYFHNNVGIHLDKSSIAVPSPTRVAGLLSDYVNNGLIQTKVQNGIHHTGHGCSRAGTNGY